MFGLPTPPQSTFTEPMLWWVFWFAIAVVVYALIAIWFAKVAKRETRMVPAAQKSGTHNEKGSAK